MENYNLMLLNSNHFILGSVGAILLILFAIILAPKLPLSISNLFNNMYFKIIFIIIILLIASKHVALSIICLVVYIIIIDNSRIKNVAPESTQEISNKKEYPVLNIPLIKSIPDITLPNVSAFALSDNMIRDVIKGFALPMISNITPNATAAMVSITPKTNEIITKIKENFADYVNDSLISENNMRTQSTSEPDKNKSDQLLNYADKLALSRNTINSILNNDDSIFNNHLINSLVKSDLLNTASNNALESGDKLSAEQLKQASLSHSSITNALVHTNLLNSVAKKSADTASTASIVNIAQDHLIASLNMINYNNNMESALDAYFHKNYELSKSYEKEAQKYLKNNITINDSIKGKAVEFSDKLYAQVPSSSTTNNNSVPPNYPPKSECDNINAIQTSGWNDYDNVNF